MIFKCNCTHVLVLFSAGGGIVILGGGGVDGALSTLGVLACVAAIGSWLFVTQISLDMFANRLMKIRILLSQY